MSDYRIVFNDHSGKYRVERRGWLGWQFVMHPDGRDYLTFDDHDAARRHVCAARQSRAPARDNRRWRVIDSCCGSTSQG